MDDGCTSQITPEQQQTIINAFKKDDPSEFQAGGIKLGNNKYMYLRQVDSSFYGKKGVSTFTDQLSIASAVLYDNAGNQCFAPLAAA